MPQTTIVFDPRYAEHQTPPNHPDQPERAIAVFEHLNREGILDRCELLKPAPAPEDLLLANHSADYLRRFRLACREGAPFIDSPDCNLSSATFDVACLAAGGVINAVEQVQAGVTKNAFCLSPPAGHHAQADAAEGFCFLNNAAIAAQHLLNHYGMERVLVIDWDMHHGNGTQNSFETDPRVLVCSIHGHPDSVYPYKGLENETGKGAGIGYTLNIPVFPGTSDSEYRAAFEQQFLPAAERFAPQFVLISAGFDTHELDPLSVVELSTDTYSWMTRKLMNLAQTSCNGKIVSVLEGGYNIESLSRSVESHLRALLAEH